LVAIGAVCGGVVECRWDIFGKLFSFGAVVWVWGGEKVWSEFFVVNVRVGGIERFGDVVSRRSFAGVVSGEGFQGRKKGLVVREGVYGNVVVVVVGGEGVGRFVGVVFSKLSRWSFVVVVSGKACPEREEEGCVACLGKDDVR
jgi:hypothetical protein